MSEISIAAVVPTIGRDSLRRAIDSILEQSHPVSELVVVNDSQAQLSLVEDGAVKGVPVVEVYTGGLTGEANARNVGIRSATASHIAYLDDDDIWLPHHLKMAVRSLQGPAGPDVYSCSAIVAHPDEARIAPTVRYTGHRPLIDFFYGAWSWAGRRRVNSALELGVSKGTGPRVPHGLDSHFQPGRVVVAATGGRRPYGMAIKCPWNDLVPRSLQDGFLCHTRFPARLGPSTGIPPFRSRPQVPGPHSRAAARQSGRLGGMAQADGCRRRSVSPHPGGKGRACARSHSSSGSPPVGRVAVIDLPRQPGQPSAVIPVSAGEIPDLLRERRVSSR